MKEIFFSIIVPVYNIESYIKECIESILSQNFTDLELILVDDGSTDNSPKICDSYSRIDNRVKVIHKKNGGLSEARNYGNKLANGKYVVYVDGDDYICKDSLSLIKKECEEQNFPDVMFVNVKKVFQNGQMIQYDEPMDKNRLHGTKKNIFSYIASRKMFPTSAWSKFVKREIIVNNNLNFNIGQLSEDYSWSIDLYLIAETFGYCKNDYYCYRQNRKGSITSNVSEKHFLDLISIIKYFIKKAEENSTYQNEILCCAAYIYRTLLWNSKPYYKQYKEIILEYRYLLLKRNNMESIIIRVVSSLFGIKMVIFLFDLIKRLRG